MQFNVRSSLPVRWRPGPFILLVVATAACGPSAKKITEWKNAGLEGTPHLVKVVKDGDVDADLRAQAASALVESGAGQEMEAAVSALDVDDRSLLAPRIVDLLAPTLRATDVNRAGDAREALTALREQTPATEVRKKIDAVLLPALVADLKAGRARVGRRELREILVTIGSPVIPLLPPLLEDPNVPFATAVEVMEKIGDEAARTAGGAALVRRAKKVTMMPDPLWDALATLGGPDVAQFLIDSVDKQAPPSAERAAVAMAKLPPDPKVAVFAVHRAGLANTPASLRERLFEVAEKNRSEECRKELLRLIASSLDSTIRYRAFRAVLKAGGGAVIPDALATFPRSARFSASEVRSELVAPIAAMPGFDTRGPLFKAFESPAPLARLVALLAIEKMGFASDATHVAKLEKDNGTVKGLPAEDRVGRQAARIAAALRKTAS